MVAEKRTKTVRMTLEQEQEFLKKVKQSGLSQEEYMSLNCNSKCNIYFSRKE